MALRSSHRDEIEAEIDRIRSLDLDALRARWRATFRSSPPPDFTKDLVARFLCWHIQKHAFGGLDPNTAKFLDRFARGDKRGMDLQLKPGTVLVPRDARDVQSLRSPGRAQGVGHTARRDRALSTHRPAVAAAGESFSVVLPLIYRPHLQNPV